MEEVKRELKWMQEVVTLRTNRDMLANDIAKYEAVWSASSPAQVSVAMEKVRLKRLDLDIGHSLRSGEIARGVPWAAGFSSHSSRIGSWRKNW